MAAVVQIARGEVAPLVSPLRQQLQHAGARGVPRGGLPPGRHVRHRPVLTARSGRVRARSLSAGRTSAGPAQRLAAGLAGRAVLQRRVRERHLVHGVPARHVVPPRARLTRPPVHPHAAPLGVLELGRGLSRRRLDRLGEDLADRLARALGVRSASNDLVIANGLIRAASRISSEYALPIPAIVPWSRSRPLTCWLRDASSSARRSSVNSSTAAPRPARRSAGRRRVLDDVHREPFAGARLGQVEAGAVVEPDAQRER